jgi:hypothetical protein
LTKEEDAPVKSYIKSALLAPAILLAVTNAAAARGDHHKNDTLRCADCHVMHYSQQHDYGTAGGSNFQPIANGPHHYLLRDEVNNLCLSCHDQGGGAPDVLGVNQNNGDIRLGGFLNRLGIEGNAPTGHTLDSTATAPGSNPAWSAEDENGPGVGLECTNCHHQHGYAGPDIAPGEPRNAYRNLRQDPGNAGFLGGYVSYNDGLGSRNPQGTYDGTVDVFERAEDAYDESDVDWNEPDNTQSAIAKFCAGCHNDFHGLVGDTNTIGGTGSPAQSFLRHPSGGVNIGAIGGGHSQLPIYNARLNKVKVMSEVGVWDPAGSDVTPTCISCHKAHGNGNAFGLIYRSGTGTLTENGDTNGTVLENLCAQCHTQASAFVGT